MAGNVVDPKVVFKRALVNRAHSIILVHNHPSGDMEPSEQHKKLTQIGRKLDLHVLDHLINSPTTQIPEFDRIHSA